jgi:hypothetical protein
MYRATWKLEGPNHQLGGASCGTRVFVYALVHVMCLCVYVNMVCQRCMLYDDMYSHDIDHNGGSKWFAISSPPCMCSSSFTFIGGVAKKKQINLNI